MSTPTRPADAISADVPGTIVALPAEARSLGVRGVRQGTCVRWAQGWITVSGVGPHHATRAAEHLLACGVTGLANWGVAGALDTGLAPGDVLIPDRILYRDDDAQGFATDPVARLRLGTRLADRLRVHGGTLWSSAQPVASRADKYALAARSGARAVDMEAAAIAAVAMRAQLPFVAIKPICDPCTRELPERVTRALGDGGISWRMIAAITLGGPATWQSTRRLAQDFSRARHSLATASRLTALAT